jgi:hypothetical protein
MMIDRNGLRDCAESMELPITTPENPRQVS